MLAISKTKSGKDLVSKELPLNLYSERKVTKAMYDFYQWVLSIGIVYFVLAIVIAIFLGNISPATIISKAARIDIRKGSGNPELLMCFGLCGQRLQQLPLQSIL